MAQRIYDIATGQVTVKGAGMRVYADTADDLRLLRVAIINRAMSLQTIEWAAQRIMDGRPIVESNINNYLLSQAGTVIDKTVAGQEGLYVRVVGQMRNQGDMAQLAESLTKVATQRADVWAAAQAAPKVPAEQPAYVAPAPPPALPPAAKVVDAGVVAASSNTRGDAELADEGVSDDPGGHNASAAARAAYAEWAAGQSIRKLALAAAVVAAVYVLVWR